MRPDPRLTRRAVLLGALLAAPARAAQAAAPAAAPEPIDCPATFFVMSQSWPGDHVHDYMTPAQLREAADFVEIGSHTINHDPNMLALRQRDRGGYWWEIDGSKAELEVLLGRPVTAFNSPVSVYDDAMLDDVAAAGYELAVMTAPDQERVPTRLTTADRYRIPRRRIT